MRTCIGCGIENSVVVAPFTVFGWFGVGPKWFYVRPFWSHTKPDTVTLQVATAIGHSTIVYTMSLVYTYMCPQLQYWLCMCVSEKLKDGNK